MTTGAGLAIRGEVVAMRAGAEVARAVLGAGADGGALMAGGGMAGVADGIGSSVERAARADATACAIAWFRMLGSGVGAGALVAAPAQAASGTASSKTAIRLTTRAKDYGRPACRQAPLTSRVVDVLRRVGDRPNVADTVVLIT